MLKIGIESAILYIASLAAFLFGAFDKDWYKVGFTLSAVFFIAASILLAWKIKSRTATRMG